MKKKFTLLIIVLATAFQGIAQDTIIGLVSRVDAPYFEQNVCDSRFAVTSEGETYYIMVDNYWPNPYLEDLVIHYDTVPVGNEIEVVGNILEMEDGNGENFSVIDITKLVYAQNYYFISYLSWLGDLFPIAYPGPDLTDAFAIIGLNDESLSFVAIDGELQTDNTWVINGAILYPNSRYLFVGSFEIWTDYYGEPFTVFNLKNAIPYGVASDNIEGILALNDSLHLGAPCLSVYDGVDHYYLTIKGDLQHGFINSELYEENTHVSVEGSGTIRYDLFGRFFTSFEIVEMQSQEEKTLSGVLQAAPMPAVGFIPVPGMTIAFFSDDCFYYIDNQKIVIDNDDNLAIIVGNDTLSWFDTELTAVFTSRTRINNHFEPYYNIFISEATVMTDLQESSISEIQIYPNPSNGIIGIVSMQPIKSITVYDSKGRMMFNKYGCSQNEMLDLIGYKGLVLIYIVFNDGCKIIEKEIVR